RQLTHVFGRLDWYVGLNAMQCHGVGGGIVERERDEVDRHDLGQELGEIAADVAQITLRSEFFRHLEQCRVTLRQLPVARDFGVNRRVLWRMVGWCSRGL